MVAACIRPLAASVILAVTITACQTSDTGRAAAAAPAGSTATHRTEIERFRHDYEARLTADNGWLTVAGLFFLSPGTRTFGSDPLNDIVLPAAAPARAGTFEFLDGVVSATAVPGSALIVNGEAVASAQLRSDGRGDPDRITIQDLTLWVHESGERRAIRLRDMHSRFREEFSGLKWFPVDDAYRVEGRFVPYDAPKTVRLPNVLGDLETMHSPGLVSFMLDGREFSMEAMFEEGDKDFWFIFRDLTSGTETDAAVRFLYAPAPVDGKVLLDFNKAQNPPCAYNPFTTCPLPPEQNRLRVRVEAGERLYE
jgi:uncharacterized protein